MSGALVLREFRRLRGITLGLALVLVLLAPAGAAWAHAKLVDSDPNEGQVLTEAPERAQLTFDEPVEPVSAGIRLFAVDGGVQVLQARSVDEAVLVRLPADLADGSYALAYRVISADGHPVSGALTFHIGASSASTVAVPEADPAGALLLVRVLAAAHYLGALLFAGLVFFEVLVAGEPALSPARRRLRRGSLVTAVSAAVALVGARALLLDPHGLAGLGTMTWLADVRASTVVLAAVTVAGGLLSWAAAGRAGWVARGRARWVRRWVAVVGAAAVALAPVLVGHSRSVQPVWLMTVLDGVHLLAAAFWLGGVVALVSALTQSQRCGPHEGPNDAGVAAELVVRFSAVAAAVVALLAVSGVVMALLILPGPAQLLTGYGTTLMVKVGLVAVIVAVAAWNRRFLRHRVEGWAALRRAMRYEAGLLALVLVVTGTLTTMSPDHGSHSADQPALAAAQVLEVSSQGLTVSGSFAPGQTGTNTLTFHLDHGGEAVTSQVQVQYRMDAAQLGPLEAIAHYNPNTGDWTAQVSCAVAGSWQLEISARISRFEQPIAIATVQVR